MAKAAKAKKPKQFYGIAEWYGHLYKALGDVDRKVLVNAKNTDIPCPFFAQVPALGPKSGRLNCNKKGGVCSLRNFVDPTGEEDQVFGAITTTCPNRFLEDGVIVRHIGKLMLGTETPLFAKEIPFLRRPRSPVAQAAVEATQEEAGAESEILDEAAPDEDREDVGRIDLVFVDPEDSERWCAVEMQAVYFSGGEMAQDYAVIRNYSGNGVPMPGVARRPDFRSSGPKRLMPQLMIKVPTLRRWGKKMVVVIDRPFLDAMAEMKQVDHMSNSDIVWVVVDYEEGLEPGKAKLRINSTLFTTLEDAVIGLTAGSPTNLPDFEGKLTPKLREALPGKSTS